jgi:flagellar motility protein MotE (MotC chaperone)
MTSLFLRIRILPVTIFVAVLMLTVKVGDIWRGVDGLLSGVGVAAAEAQQQAGQQARQAAAQSAAPEAGTAAMPADGGEQTAAADAAPAAKGDTFADDPTLFTQSEIDLLQQLAERRDKLEKRERELDMREGLLQAAEARIDNKVEELKRLQSTIQDLVKVHDEQQDQKMRSLVKIYENMKPKDAARIFEELDMDTLLMVAERMKERKLAPVMAKMNPAKAKEMTVELARLRELPTPGQGPGG